MCNSFGNTNPDRKTCATTPTAGAGATHIRYDCSTGGGTFWLLTYVWSDIYFDRTPDNMWVVNKCGATCAANDNKFVKYPSSGSAAASGGCAATCPRTCDAASTSCWCCQNLWPIIDGTAGWIGFMARVSFNLAPGSTVSSDNMMVHFDWGTSQGSTANTGSTSNGQTGTGSAGVCFSCAGEGGKHSGLQAAVDCLKPARPMQHQHTR